MTTSNYKLYFKIKKDSLTLTRLEVPPREDVGVHVSIFIVMQLDVHGVVADHGLDSREARSERVSVVDVEVTVLTAFGRNDGEVAEIEK